MKSLNPYYTGIDLHKFIDGRPKATVSLNPYYTGIDLHARAIHGSTNSSNVLILIILE